MDHLQNQSSKFTQYHSLLSRLLELGQLRFHSMQVRENPPRNYTFTEKNNPYRHSIQLEEIKNFWQQTATPDQAHISTCSFAATHLILALRQHRCFTLKKLSHELKICKRTLTYWSSGEIKRPHARNYSKLLKLYCCFFLNFQEK